MTDEEKQNHLSAAEVDEIRRYMVGDPEFADVGDAPYGEDILKNWTEIPANSPVTMTLTRRDLDHLFFSMAQLNATVGLLQLTMKMLSNGDSAAADAAYSRSIELRIMSGTNFRKFFGSIMASAKSHE